MTNAAPRGRARWLLLSMFAAIGALATVVAPYYVMRPFAAQDPGALTLVLSVARHSLWILALCLTAGLLAAVRAWPGGGWTRWPRRLFATLAVLLIGAATYGSQVNLFEEMFAPLAAPRYVATGEAGLADDEVVLAVALGGAARAYPVRVLAYHHVLGDELAGEPIVVTY
jgi:hypothetical protein